MILPGCDNCGDCGCTCGSLPYTLTLTFSGLKNQTHTEHCALTFTSDFGCNAAGVGMTPGGNDTGQEECGASDRGPLTCLLTNGGQGYAKLGRIEPTLTITGSGSGCIFTPTLAAVDGSLAEQCRSYALQSVSVSGGSGYTDGESLTIRADGKTVTAAHATLHTVTTRSEPTVTASVAGGTGATLSVSLATNGGSPETWGVASVSVANAGSGHTFDCGESGAWSSLPVTFATADETTTAATGTAYPQIAEPTGYASMQTSGGGSGFAGTLSFSATTDGNGRPAYTVTGITIDSAGSGYAVDDTITLFADYVSECGIVLFTVTSVDGTGGITGLSAPITDEGSGPYWGRFTGGIGSVSVDSAGAYYKLDNNGVPTSVTVTNAGEYYTEDMAAPACVANITVEPCGGGVGATIEAVVDDDNTSPTFGAITALNVTDAGSDYLAWRWVCLRQYALNGQDIVLKAANPRRLVFLRVESNFGSGACLRIPLDPAWDGTAVGITDVEVVNGGTGYAVSGETATVTIHVDQADGSSGAGFSADVVIGTNPMFAGFGQITGVTINNPGSGYFPFGGPTDCIYTAACEAPGMAEGGVEVTATVKGNKPIEVELLDSRHYPVLSRAVFRGGTVIDCDALPATATLWYGAQAGAAVGIANGGAYVQPEIPGDCAPCDCPAEAITGDTCITITSDYPCVGGNAGYSGPLKDLNIGCSWTDPLTNFTYESDVSLLFECCECLCPEGYDCTKKYRVILSGHIYGIGEPSGAAYLEGYILQDECGDGPFEIQWSEPYGIENGVQVPANPRVYTFTVQIGGGEC